MTTSRFASRPASHPAADWGTPHPTAANGSARPGVRLRIPA
ncbi:hypothetical protein QE430_000650 [Microbacterium testaceum]|nr:hypothetical protein [Microbacterium testaceum]MDQ1172343.1 hypothetical protein [Microbacterium testaceum]